VTRKDLIVTADPVFHLTPAPPEWAKNVLEKLGLPPGAPFVAVSVRDWTFQGDFLAQLARLCDHLRQKHRLEVLFLHMQPSRDRAVTALVREQMKERSYVLDEPCSPQELMAVLGQAKLCLAMRLHTLIFSARMSIPAMGLIYDPKVESYLRELDLPAAGYVDSFNAPEAMLRADKLLADYAAVLQRLREKSAALTAAAQENERLLLELLEKTKQ
jgi:polysaccharide pyruvyl transferase WcaK-like protein